MSTPRALRRRFLFAGTTLAAATAAWLATHVLPWPARVACVLLLVALPAIMLLQARFAGAAPLDPSSTSRRAIYVSSATVTWTIAALSFAAAVASGFDARLLGLVAPDPVVVLAWIGALTGAGVGVIVLARLLGATETAVVDLVLPRTPGERLGFVALSLSAGVGEELAYRGFLLPALGAAAGSLWLGAAIASVAFGMMHAYQGVVGVLRASILGMLLSLPVVLSGTVIPAMAAHALIDVVAGLLIADWLMRR